MKECSSELSLSFFIKFLSYNICSINLFLNPPHITVRNYEPVEVRLYFLITVILAVEEGADYLMGSESELNTMVLMWRLRGPSTDP